MVNSLLQNIKNIPGWRSGRKLLIIECDDWGGINMPSNEAYGRMLAAGLRVDLRKWNRSDTLETAEDLVQLFKVLESVRDSNNRSAVLTAVTNMANPDFTKIRDADFTEYYFEKFTDTLARYYPDSNVFGLYGEGIAAGIFVPVLHGREHLSTQLWMKELQRKNKDLHIAFDNGFVSLDVAGTAPEVRGFRTEFYFTGEDEKPFLHNSIRDSVELFREIFGYQPKVFVPANGVFHPDFAVTTASSGVKYLWVNHLMRYRDSKGASRVKWIRPGQKGPGGITYYLRNCSFEPNGEMYMGVDFTLKQVEAAFRWRKPAIISTHRASYVGGLDPANRLRGLTELEKLLKGIVRKWPDVEFVSSPDAFEYMESHS
jgi:hypothetical protein